MGYDDGNALGQLDDNLKIPDAFFIFFRIYDEAYPALLDNLLQNLKSAVFIRE